jgi:hypothetical protein
MSAVDGWALRARGTLPRSSRGHAGVLPDRLGIDEPIGVAVSAEGDLSLQPSPEGSPACYLGSEVPRGFPGLLRPSPGTVPFASR